MPSRWALISYLECGRWHWIVVRSVGKHPRTLDTGMALNKCQCSSPSPRPSFSTLNLGHAFLPVRREQLFMWSEKGRGISTFLEAKERQRRWVRRVCRDLESPKDGQCICKRENWEVVRSHSGGGEAGRISQAILKVWTFNPGATESHWEIIN